jgi:branched-chain amino acid transport system substrate-binding protein
VVQLVPTATSHLLGDVGPWTFTLPPNDSVEGAVLGRFAAEYLRARRVALFYVPDEYGMGLRVAAMRKLREKGVRVVDNVPVAGGADLEVLLGSSLKRSPPDLILSLCPAGQTGAIARIAERLQPGLRILAGDAATTLSELNQTGGNSTDSIYVATFWIPPGTTETARKFTERYQAMTGKTPEAGDALVYDAIMLLATAASNVGTRREMIRQYLEALGSSRPPYQGVSGPIAFGSHRMSSVIIARVRHGGLEAVNWQ